jgi:hypothetical protein
VNDEGTRSVSESGRHSFGYFSVAEDRKVTRHQGETNLSDYENNKKN